MSASDLPPRRRWGIELVVLGSYWLISILMSWPLVTRLATHIGGQFGDGPRFLWNLWWVDRSLAGGASPLSTDLLFHPLGADLTLHTLTLLHGLAGRLLLPWMGLIGTYNLIFLLGGTLAAWGTYRLSRELAAEPWAAWVSGLIFGFCPYHAIRGMGHGNLAATYCLPLVIWGWLRVVRRGGLSGVLWAGLWLGATAYVSYYYALYLGLLGLLLAGYLPLLLVERVQPGRWHRAGSLVLLTGLAGLVLVVGDRPLLRMGFSGPVRLVLAGLLLRSLGLIQGWGRGLRGGLRLRRRLLLLGVTAALGFLIAAPLLGAISDQAFGQAGVRLDRQSSILYSADLLSFLTPPPWHSLTGGRWSGTLAAGSGGIEAWTYLGWIPLALGVAAAIRYRRESWVRFWALMALISAVLALGPVLQVGGAPVHPGGRSDVLILPFALLQDLPFLSGARVPSRWSILVVLALGVLTARFLSGCHRRTGLCRIAALAAAGLVLADFALLPYPLQELDRPGLVQEIARDDRIHQVVLDLPLGIGHGSWGLGKENPRMFHRQTIHRRPVLGGFTARGDWLPFQYYRDMPLTAAILALQEGDVVLPTLSPPDRASFRRQTDALRIGYAVMDRDRFEEPARTVMHRFVEEVLGFQPVGEQGWMALWRNPRLSREPPDRVEFSLSDSWEAQARLGRHIQAGPRGLRLLAGELEVGFPLAPVQRSYRLRLEAACDGPRPRRLMIRCNDRPAGSLTIRPDLGWAEVTIPPDRLVSGWNRLRIDPDAFPPGAFPVGATGGTGFQPIRILSVHWDRQKLPFLEVGDRGALTVRQGLNLIALDPKGERIIARLNYYSRTAKRGGQELEQFAAGLPEGALVAACLWDSGGGRLPAPAHRLLARLGAKLPGPETRPGAYAMVGRLDAPPGSAVEISGEEEAHLELPNSVLRFHRFLLEPMEVELRTTLSAD